MRSVQLLADVHIIGGRRMRTYMEAVEATLGRRGAILLAWCARALQAGPGFAALLCLLLT